MDVAPQSLGTALVAPPRATPRRLPLATTRGIVFVVDDEPNVLRTVGDLLATEYEVHRFGTGEDALYALERVWPDVVLLDVLLPGIDGIEVCRRMKQRAGDVPLPVVLVTALDSTADRMRGLTAGADDFLTKPVHQSELRARVANLVKVGRYHALLQAQRDKAAADARDLRAQLVEAERLAQLGTFGAGVSHELNNIATVLLGSLGALEKGDLTDAEARQHLRSAAEHVKALALTVLRAARPQPSVAREVDLISVAREVESMTRVTGRSKYVHVELLAPETPVLVHVPPVQAQQVLLNLIVNAADALNELGIGDLKALGRAGLLAHLESLDLSGCVFPEPQSDAVLDGLARLGGAAPVLARLDVSGCQLPPESVKALRARLGGIDFTA